MIAAAVLAVTLAQPIPAAEATSRQVIVNGNFSAGATGWKTLDSRDHLFSVARTGRGESVGAQLKLANTSQVVFGTTKKTVRSTAAGQKYSVAVWVRSSRPGVSTELRLTEAGTAGTETHRFSLKLRDTQWRKLSLNIEPKWTGSSLDMSILFTGTAAGQRLYVDDASFLMSPTAPTETPTSTPTPSPTPEPTATQTAEPSPRPTTTPTTPPASPTPIPTPTRTPAPTPTQPPTSASCERPAPPSGTQFGSSISMTSTIWAEHALADRDAIFGDIAAVRIWDQPMPFSWSDQRTPHLAGRTLVMSFRPLPADVLSGKHDAELRKWFRDAPAASTIYWNYYHEPETPIDDDKTFTAAEYIQAWKHIDAIADSVCRQNMYSTLVLMGWTAQPASQKDWRTYYPGDDVIDVLAFDPYNGVHDPQRDYYASPASLLDSVVNVARQAGKPWALAEIGSRKIPSDPTGSVRAAWLTSVADYSRTNGALFVTYFQSSRDGEWRLLDKPSQDAWRAAVAGSPR